MWRNQCRCELSLTSLDEVPPAGIGSGPSPPSFFYLFLAWSLSFQGYRRADVRAMRCWWLQLEAWIGIHAAPLLPTLNPPASETDLASTTGTPTALPYLLRLLYRFHNGQKALFRPDAAVGGDSESELLCQSVFFLSKMNPFVLMVWACGSLLYRKIIMRTPRCWACSGEPHSTTAR